jgi:hypothetical protein
MSARREALHEDEGALSLRRIDAGNGVMQSTRCEIFDLDGAAGSLAR